MFLSRLNNIQKELFIQLCLHAALANDSFEKEEELMISEYCKEMAIANPGNVPRIELDEVIEKLVSISSDRELNIIAFEIAALFVSDNEYSQKEQVFMNNMINRFEIESEKVETMFGHIEEYNSICYKIAENVLN